MAHARGAGDVVGPYRAGIAGWALCLALGSLLSASICVAGESEKGGSPYSTSRSGAYPVETPIDVTMARLAHLERVAGVNSAHLSAAGRNLFSLAERWTAIRERLVKGAARPAQFDELSRARSIVQNPLATRDSKIGGGPQERDSNRVVRCPRGDRL